MAVDARYVLVHAASRAGKKNFHALDGGLVKVSSEGFDPDSVSHFILSAHNLSLSLPRGRPHPNDRIYRVRSKKLLEPAIATDWSMTHSPMPRYLLSHLLASLLSPATFSVLKLETLSR